MNLESGVLTNDMPNRVDQRLKFIDCPAKQHEYDEFFGLAALRSGARDDNLVEVHVRKLRDDLLNIVRIIVLAVDNNDVFLTARDYQVTINKHAAVARAQPAIVREQLGRGFSVTVNPFSHTVAAQQYVADMPIGKRLIIIAG